MPTPKRILRGLPTLGRVLDARSGKPAASSSGAYPRPGQPGGPRLPLGLPPGTGGPMPSTLLGGSTPGGCGHPGGAEAPDPYAPAFPEQFTPVDAEYLLATAHGALPEGWVIEAGDGLDAEFDSDLRVLTLRSLAQPQCYCPGQGQDSVGSQPGDGFLWESGMLSGASSPATITYSNRSVYAASGGSYNCWTELFGRWSWTSNYSPGIPPALPLLAQSWLRLGRPLPTALALKLRLHLRVNNPARFTSIELWFSDHSGNETARHDVLAGLTGGAWVVDASSHNLSALDGDCVLFNLEAVGTSSGVNVGATELDLESVIVAGW